jgi:predicted ABC-type ATPase
MAKSSRSSPLCIIIAGPNGAGKTTFAREFLSREMGVVYFVNLDLIASGLSPLRPALAALAAGRLFLRELAESGGGLCFREYFERAYLH